MKPRLRIHTLRSLMAAFALLAAPNINAPAELDLPRGVTDAQRQDLWQLRQKALTGNFAALKDYWRTDLAVYFPHWQERIVFVQGDEPASTPLSTFTADYRRAWLAAGAAPDADGINLAAAFAYHDIRVHNISGTPVTYYEVTPSGFPIPIVAMPASRCAACFNARQPVSEQSCQPIHPDTLFWQGMDRLRTTYHEQAHALRMLRGEFRYQTEAEQHMEEVIAELYGDARLIQSFGAVAIGVVERSLHREPLYNGSSRHYIAYQGREQQLHWLREQGQELANLHPTELLAQAITIAQRTLLSPAELATLRRFEEQTPFVTMGAVKRKELASAQAAASTEEAASSSPAPAGDDVRDDNQCRWNYPQVMREIDRKVINRAMPAGARLADIMAQNHLRPSDIQGAGPFAIDKTDPAQVEAIISFNLTLRPAACPALTPEQVRGANLWLPQPKAPPVPETKAKLCPS